MALNKRSQIVTQGVQRSPNRAMLRAVGFKDADFKKPIVGIANGYSTITPCNLGLNGLAVRAEAAAKKAGAMPQMFGTRRVGPDLIRESGVHSNDWHVAHFYDPVAIQPGSVMPSFSWFYDEKGRPNKKGLAIVSYVQWLGSWRR